MRRTLIAATLLLLMLHCTVFGFNGMRTGFVVGGGLGLAPMARWSVDVPAGGVLYTKDGVSSESNFGAGFHLFAGYAWDEYNMVVAEGNGCAYKSDAFNVSSDLNGNAAQGFGGVAWYHYFGPLGQSFFSTVGVGGYGWKVKGYAMNDIGFGYLVGGGYEFHQYFQAGVYFSGGQTSDVGVDFGHMQITVLVTAVAH
jgi:hypothetical protein